MRPYRRTHLDGLFGSEPDDQRAPGCEKDVRNGGLCLGLLINQSPASSKFHRHGNQ